MTMTNEEIVRDFREAANKVKQIGILADLNACSKTEIRKILTDAGEAVPYARQGEKPAKKPAPKKQKVAPAPQADEPKAPTITTAQVEEIIAEALHVSLETLMGDRKKLDLYMAIDLLTQLAWFVRRDIEKVLK